MPVYKIYLISMLGFFLAIFSSCKKESAFQALPKPQVVIDGKRATSNLIHLVKDTMYVLAVNLTRDSGQTLIADPGTLIKINNNLGITINPGGSIQAAGTATDPVVFTSSSNKGAQGQGANGGNWNGIRITGNTAGRSLGILSFVRIEFAGLYTSALFLENVGVQTTVNHVEISYSYNFPSFEFNGGNCNAAFLLSYASAGTDFLLENGYTGILQNILAYRYPFYASMDGNLAGVYIRDATTEPVISNLTVIGPDQRHGSVPGYVVGTPNRRAALITGDNAVFHIRNSVFMGFPFYTWFLYNYNTSDSIDKMVSHLENSILYNSDSSKIFYLAEDAYPPYHSTDFRNFMMLPEFNNELFLDSMKFQISDPFNYYGGIPNPVPESSSPLLTGANFDDPYYSDPFFRRVPYRGAIGQDNWLQGWVNFTPLQTEYNY